MSKIKKFRKNNWWDSEEDVTIEKRSPKKKQFDRALRSKDVDFFNDEYDEY